MKKLAIFFLLTTMIAAFSFGQSVKADLSFGNIAGANEADMDPALELYFSAGGSKELGPGNLTFGGNIGYKMHFTDGDTAKDKPRTEAYEAGDNDFTVGYNLPAGPGTLAISLKFEKLFTNIQPGVDYDGLAVGPATLGFGAWYAFKTTGEKDGKASVFGEDEKTDGADEFGARLSAGFEFGLNVTYKFVYGIGIEEIAKIVYLDANFAISAVEGLVVGLEVDDTGKEFKGFTLKPYVNYGLNENVSAGVYFKLANLNAEGDSDMVMTPGIWVKYSL